MASTVKLVPAAYHAVDQRGYRVGFVDRDPDHPGRWRATRNRQVLESNATTEEAREVIEAVINAERTP